MIIITFSEIRDNEIADYKHMVFDSEAAVRAQRKAIVMAFLKFCTNISDTITLDELTDEYDGSFFNYDLPEYAMVDLDDASACFTMGNPE